MLKKGTVFFSAVIIAVTGFFIFAAKFTSISSIDVHEHMKGLSDAKRLLGIMDGLSIEKTVLLGSPEQTFIPSKIKNQAFTNYDQNNSAILSIARAYPGRFIPFCVGSQNDREVKNKIAECVAHGGMGVKLFSGHGSFYTKPLNDRSLMPFYQYLAQEKIPVMWHVNASKYYLEFIDVLKKFPDLKVICPHYCLLSKNLPLLSGMLDVFPDLYIDTSFGGPDILAAGFKTIGAHREDYRVFFEKYQDRIFWGTDFVITRGKSSGRIQENYEANRDILEKSEFDYDGNHYQGLDLPFSILKKVYRKNFEKFIKI